MSADDSPDNARGKHGTDAKWDRISSLAEGLRSRQMPSGGWGYFDSGQESVEATCLAALALAPEMEVNSSAAVKVLLNLQLRNGGWPAFRGDLEGSWTTALAICALNATGEFTDARENAVRWLDSERGREGHWFWRWKFKTVDRSVRFDPDKYGWPWSPGAASWVIPTAFSILALKQFTACTRDQASENRIRLGVEMLLDRACADGGWNAGNSAVFGVPLGPQVEATAIALLALQDEERSPVIHAGLEWLKGRAARIQSVESLAWCILNLFVYQEPIEQLKKALTMNLGESLGTENAATLATALLALKCGEMIHPFEVLR
jgi:squalene cyclase